MTDRMTLLETVLDSLPEGVVLLDGDGGVAFWNRAAEDMTGYAAPDLLAKPVPDSLKPLLESPRAPQDEFAAAIRARRGTLVRPRHKLGHELPAIARTLILRDEMGEQVGAAALFHPAERLDALPHGETSGNPNIAASQSDLDERLLSEFEDFERGGQALGVLWIAVDQGAELRKSHGAAASQAMLEKMRHALAAGLRPAEEMGPWGDDEFLVIAHERNAEMLAGHARTLAGLARTADFRWWGDRVSLTVSIGAAQATQGELLAQLLKRARKAMEASALDGGNRVTFAPLETHPSEEAGVQE